MKQVSKLLPVLMLALSVSACFPDNEPYPGFLASL